jgi:murein DD-endopeptidase MepM/ murein hydrolase activator NlpD
VAVVASVAVAFTTFFTLLGDWVQLRKLTVEARTFKQQIDDQQATIDSFNRRVVELRQEMAGWRDLHARIWEPFGPELQPGGRDRAIGGGALRPDSKTGRLSPRDELEQLAENVAEQGESLKALDRLVARAGKALAALPSRWPVRGAVNSEYGMRQSPWSQGTEFHSGIDIRSQHGTAVRAPAAGTVTVAGTYQEYGIAVILDHGQDIKSLYGHLSRMNVKPGDRVERGTVVGWSGNTGRSTGAHLHYEILVKGQAVNPRAYLWD